MVKILKSITLTTLQKKSTSRFHFSFDISCRNKNGVVVSSKSIFQHYITFIRCINTYIALWCIYLNSACSLEKTIFQDSYSLFWNGLIICITLNVLQSKKWGLIDMLVDMDIFESEIVTMYIKQCIDESNAPLFIHIYGYVNEKLPLILMYEIVQISKTATTLPIAMQ